MSKAYNPLDWYWIVGGDTSKVYSSKRNIYVVPADADYVAWSGGVANAGTPIDSEASLAAVLQAQAPTLIPAWMFDATNATTFVQPSAGAYTADHLKRYAASARYLKETGGITVNGAAVATDRTSQAMITGAYNMATNNSAFTTLWKNPDGSFTTLNAQAIIAIAVAVGNHVSACFAKEQEVDAGIIASPPTYTTTASIDAAFAAVTT